MLVVEDDYFFADEIGRTLRSFGAEVAGPVGYLAQGFDMLSHAESIDAAVLDVNIGGEMVFGFARALQKRKVPFIFATGYDRSMISAEFADTPLWEKPADFAAIALQLIDHMQGTVRD